jgi:hypothetical protein
MALRGRIGGLTTHSRHDSREITRAARERFLTSFIDQVDPERTLPEAERLRRAEAARRAHMARLAHASAKARRARRPAGVSPTDPDQRSPQGA